MVDFNLQISTIVQSMLNLETLWKLNKFKPNDQQREAITTVDGPLFITAGPGSGKTSVLLWRALNLIVFHGVKPDEIFLSTFTEKAAHQLKDGLRVLLSYATNINGKPYDLSHMYIGTVHSLCRRILNDRRKFLQDYHANPTPTLLDELSQYFHISKIRNWQVYGNTLNLEQDESQNRAINLIFGSNLQAKHAAVTNSVAFFNRCSEECINPGLVINAIQSGNENLSKNIEQNGLNENQLIKAYGLYQTYLETLQVNDRLRVTDFSLLQQEAYKVLLDREESGYRFKHIIIDEYQDTNTIQEKIFFRLAHGYKNICVVGDDDQALYRFRGATVENFVDFPARCRKYLAVEPKRISLDTNYRSRKKIVEFYTNFITCQTDWKRLAPEEGYYRVMDKQIQAHNGDENLSVVASTPGAPEIVCAEIANLVNKLIKQGKVEDPNQIAFLYPSLKSIAVENMQNALEAVGLRVYAPRAHNFLEVPESYDVFGMLALILGLPEIEGGWGGDYEIFGEWLRQIEMNAKRLAREDLQLRQFVVDKRGEVERACKDFEILKYIVNRENWSLKKPFDIDRMMRKLYEGPGISSTCKKLLGSEYLRKSILERQNENRPYSLEYIIKRVTSLDWSLLDLFYRLMGFDHFKQMFDLAESGEDEGPVCNLSLITQYLARFVDEFIPMLTADLIVDGIFHRIFYFSFLFSIYRLGESEYEDSEDPFPKGRIPFLTIHQSKGLEFPVVVLGNPRRTLHSPGFVERAIFPFCENENGEPLGRQAEFDAMRMFYVALSRAQNMMIIAHFKGIGQQTNEPFKTLLDEQFPRIPDLNLDTMPVFHSTDNVLPKMYSYTSDYLHYKKCPRQYMLFRKYNFVPSRAQTMLFGSLVHQTLEDLHHEIIRRREGANNGA